MNLRANLEDSLQYGSIELQKSCEYFYISLQASVTTHGRYRFLHYGVNIRLYNYSTYNIVVPPTLGMALGVVVWLESPAIIHVLATCNWCYLHMITAKFPGDGSLGKFVSYYIISRNL